MNYARFKVPLVALLVTTLSAFGRAAPVRSADCLPVTIGVQPVPTDTVLFPFNCRGWGQVFLASDTMIHSISVWRRAYPAHDDRPRQLFITEVFDDSFGVRPDVNRVLLTGPVLVIPDGDGVHPVEYRWVFDPPFALPYRGKFFFDIMADPFTVCPVAADSTDPYPDGLTWYTGPVWDCSQPGQPFGPDYPTWDLAFEVQFCTLGAVGVPPPGARPLSLSALPNPFRDELHVSFDLPSSTYVRLAVFDLAGRRVATLVEGDIGPGPHSVPWSEAGQTAGSGGTGLFFIRLEAEGQRLSRTVVRIR